MSSQQELAIKPSADAIEIDAAHKLLRDAIGTENEALARAYLDEVVRKVSERRRAK